MNKRYPLEEKVPGQLAKQNGIMREGSSTSLFISCYIFLVWQLEESHVKITQNRLSVIEMHCIHQRASLQ